MARVLGFPGVSFLLVFLSLVSLSGFLVLAIFPHYFTISIVLLCLIVFASYMALFQFRAFVVFVVVFCCSWCCVFLPWCFFMFGSFSLIDCKILLCFINYLNFLFDRQGLNLFTL